MVGKQNIADEGAQKRGGTAAPQSGGELKLDARAAQAAVAQIVAIYGGEDMTVEAGIDSGLQQFLHQCRLERRMEAAQINGLM